MIIMALPNINGYAVLQKIGVGGFSVVYKAVAKTPTRDVVAIKCIEKQYQRKSFADSVVKEISLLKLLKHEFIVKFVDFMWDSKYLYIITEYCDEGNLSQFIRKKHKLAETLVKVFMQQLALAIKYLRSHSICHMDLKSENILLCSKPMLKLKVADFGLSQIISEDNVEPSHFSGSILYMAPEKLLKQRYDARVDLYSVGIIMYECLFGRVAFANMTVKAIIDHVVANIPITLPREAHISQKCENLLFRLLKYDPNERISFEDFFNHEFLDITHMATPENYLYALKLTREAIILDMQQQYAESLPKYTEAIKFLEMFIHLQNDPLTKALYTTRMNEYVKWTNTLSDILAGKISPPKTVFTPEITEPLSTGNAAEMYLAQGNKAEALKLLITVLDKLIPILRREPAGMRKTFLHAQVCNWLALAENLKKTEPID